MNPIQIIILGAVQGITEWLPISSDGHLVVLEKIMRLAVTVSFDVFLHLGSLLVILIFFRQPLVEFLKHLFGRPSQWPIERNRWWLYLLISTVVTGILGLSFYPYIENFRTIGFAANGFLFTSLFLLATRWSKSGRSIGYPEAFVLGLVQGLAVLPGVSRSGLVLSLALLLGAKKEDAFDYTFFLAVPAIIAAFVLAVKDLAWQPIYLLGLLMTIIVGLLALFLLRNIVQRDKLYWFCIYTFVLAMVLKLL
ncbi:MAG: undecaprenyl-diphosphate phosphatase [Patescibacteria group bacterium]